MIRMVNCYQRDPWKPSKIPENGKISSSDTDSAKKGGGRGMGWYLYHKASLYFVSFSYYFSSIFNFLSFY